MAAELSDELVRFLNERIATAEHLEVVLLLQRSPDKWFTAAGVGDELGAETRSIANALDDLCSQNLLDVRVSEDVVFRFAPQPRDEPVLRELVEAYRARRLTVLRMFSRRSEGIFDFAEAFRLTPRRKAAK